MINTHVSDDGQVEKVSHKRQLAEEVEDDGEEVAGGPRRGRMRL